MPGVRAYRITAEFVQKVGCYIKNGAYPHEAAEAEGVPRRVFEEWLRRGERRRGPSLYRQLADTVRSSQATARILAESHIFKNKPEVWLRYGPGRETVNAPGWSAAPKPGPRTDDRADGLLAPAQLDAIFRIIKKTLDTHFPGASEKVAAALAGAV